MSLARFVRRSLPPAPARILEIGCRPLGDLPAAIAAAGSASVAVDPVASAGPLLRRIPFEDVTEPGRFAAIVASLAMHHIAAVRRTAARIRAVLVPGGRCMLEAWDRERLLDAATARWSFPQRQAAAVVALRPGDAPGPLRSEAWRRAWSAAHGHRHGEAAMRAQLMAPFPERFFTWRPYLSRDELHESREPLERALIEEGTLQATGCRWVGEFDPPT